MMEPRGQELVDRYKKFFNMSFDAGVTEEMILAHWELEKRSTKELLESIPENRWETFERSYGTLYGELDWLNRLVNASSTLQPSELYRDWIHLIGEPPKRIYEVGSGTGELISYLASCGFECRATEITRERGQKHVSECSNLSWASSDGIHLDEVEAPNSYDVVVSNCVVEHQHPDDLYDHFKGVLSILSSGGSYIFYTPHVCTGPWDISRVFKYDRPIGMHLKEYAYQELKELLAQAGFRETCAVLLVATRTSRFLPLGVKPKASRIYLIYLCFLEKLILLLPRQALRRKAAMLSRAVLFSRGVFIVARKE